MNWHPNKQLSVLHVGLVAPNYGNDGIMKGLLGGGFSVYRLFDYQRIMFEYDKEHMRRMLIKEVEQFKPDLVFCQIQSSEILDKETFSRLGQIAFTVNYSFDIRSKEQTEWMYNIGPYIGLTCFSNQDDVDEYTRRGYENAMCLHSSADTDVYKPAQSAVSKHGIAFIGNNFHNTLMPFPKSKQRVEMVESLKVKFGDYFSAYGLGWYGEMANTSGEVSIYQHASMAINQTNYDATNYTSDRLWRILATGCLCVTEYFEGIENLFVNHVELVWWKTLGELVELLYHYMVYSGKAHAIGINGMSAMLTRHTWKNRIEEMMAFIKKLNSKVWVFDTSVDACTKAGAHVIGGIIPGPEDEHLAGRPCDCGKLKGSFIECGCTHKKYEFRWTENI